MAKRIKRAIEKWGGRKLQAIINGKDVCVKRDPHNLTYFMNPPKGDGKERKRIWLSRDIGKAANEFWAYIEQSNKQKQIEIPTYEIRTVTDYSHLTPEGTLEAWKKSIESDPKKYWTEFSKDLLKFTDDLTPYETYCVKQKLTEKYNPRIKTEIPEEILINIFRQWLEDPYECSLKLGDERIARLDKLSQREPIKLIDMGDHYFNWIPTERDQASEKERQKIVNWWKQFCRIVNKTYLDEIGKPDIALYTNTIVTTAKNENRSKTWISHRFGACKTIINTFARSLEDKALCNKITGWFRDYPAPKSVNHKSDDFSPNRLTKKQWNELFSIVNENCSTTTEKEWKAIILFALNTCSYAVDCRNALTSNLNGNELRMKRGKRGKVPKIGILWDVTINAISQFRQGKIANSKYLFPSRNGSKYTEGGFYDHWSKFIKTKLSWDFDFNQLRDSGRYGAETGNASPNQIAMAMGHRLKGTDDNYLFRHPELVKDVANAIYNYYIL